MPEAYWFSIRGDCKMSLCLTTMFTVPEFAKLLLVGKFVTFRRMGGTLRVQTSEDDIWNAFLDEFKLRLSGKNVAECTKSSIKNYDAFKKKKKAFAENGMEVLAIKPFYMLRIGNYKEGETKNAAGQLSLRLQPPDLNRNRKLRTAQRQLYLSVKECINSDNGFD